MTRMKESGIDWIGLIPEGWEVSRLKYFFDIYAGGDIDERNTVDEYSENHPYPVISNSLENEGILGYTSNFRFQGDSVTVTGRGDVGKAVYRNIKFYPVVRLLVCIPKKQVDCRFVTYWINSAIIEKNQTAVSQLTIQMLGELIFTKVPYLEQKKIADFLDKKTAQLDKVKTILEAQIQKLKDYRASLIYETVTKGLDKTVPMKNSGIDWIGQVPQGWGVDFANHIFEEHKQKNKGNKEKNLLSLSYGRIIRKSIDSSFGLLPESFDTYNIIQRGDIVLRLTDLQNDKKSLRVGLARENGIITSAYLTLRLKNIGCSDSYMYYLLHTYDICKVFYNFGGGVRQGGTWSDIYKLELLIPPYNEQAQITDFLDKKTAQIDQLIQIKNQQIKNINKQRQTLIYDYVTGKRRV